MNPIAKNSSIIVLGFGLLFLKIELFVPQPATALSRSERVGNSWGAGCWKEVATPGSNKDRCNTDLTCRSCCDRKRDSCKRKYPNSKAKCENYWTFCMDRQRKPTSIPGGTGLKAPSGRVKRTPSFGQRLRQMQIQQYFQYRRRCVDGVCPRGIGSPGMESTLPLVIPEPVPPTRPTLER